MKTKNQTNKKIVWKITLGNLSGNKKKWTTRKKFSKMKRNQSRSSISLARKEIKVIENRENEEERIFK